MVEEHDGSEGLAGSEGSEGSEGQGWRDPLDPFDPFGVGDEEPADVFDADVIGSSGWVLDDARRAGDDAVDALAKVTAHMAGGENRPEQQEMCRAVAEAIVTQTHLVVQAGTGTGKSLAYLVPAALSGKKVVVATATKALPSPRTGSEDR